MSSISGVRNTGSARPGSPFFLGGSPTPPAVLNLQRELNVLEKKVRAAAADAQRRLASAARVCAARARVSCGECTPHAPPVRRRCAR
jgi:hypothetical protein